MIVKSNKDANASATIGQQGRENKFSQNPISDKNNGPEFKTNNLNKTSSKFDKNVIIMSKSIIF